METFRFYFHRRRNYIDVYLHPVTPDTFQRRGGGRWAYFEPCPDRSRAGLFGELHFVAGRVREDTVAHELLHVLADYLRQRKMELNERNEERIAAMLDELVRNFYKEYRKL